MSATAMAAAIFIAAACPAQMLDLNQPGVPAAGQGAAALALAESLRTRLAADDRAAVRPAAARVATELRRLARELILAGEQAGPGGSARLLAGRTLADAAPAIEAYLSGDPAPIDEPTLELAAIDLRAASDSAKTADLDRLLRDALATLVQSTPPPSGSFGWAAEDASAGTPTASQPAPPVDLSGVSAEARAAWGRFDALAASAQRWPAYQRSAAGVRALAAAAAGALAAPPEWLSPQARTQLARELDAALQSLAPADSQAAALGRLARLAEAASVIRRLDALPASPAVKKARGELSIILAEAPANVDASRRSLFQAGRVLAIIDERAPLDDDRQIVRQLRPASRTIAAAARQTELGVLAVLPEVFRLKDAMTDPAILAPLAAHRQNLADLVMLRGLSRALAPGIESLGDRAPADPAWSRLMERVLRHAQDVAKPDRRDEAIEALRQFAQTAQLYRPLDGEADLDAAANESSTSPTAGIAAWRVLTGERVAAVKADLADRRTLWRSLMERGAVDAAAAEALHLANLRDLLGILREAATVHAVLSRPSADGVDPAYAVLEAWPGWCLSITGLRAVTPEIAKSLPELTRLVIESPNDAQPAAAKSLQAAAADLAAARLAARLMRDAAARGCTAENDAGSLLYELGTGGPIAAPVPGRAWLASSRADLADLCRYAEELPAAQTLGARDRAAQLRALVNARAAHISDSLGP